VDPLPTAPSCALDGTGLRAQYERYRRAGAGAHVVERSPLRLVVELDEHVDPALVEETIAIERECCPFYELGWAADRRRLSVSVSQADQAPALDAIELALGLETSVQRAASD
jgi:hypothetical protein